MKSLPLKFTCAVCKTTYTTIQEPEHGTPNFQNIPDMGGDVCDGCLKDHIVNLLKTNGRGHLYLSEKRDPLDYGLPFLGWVPNHLTDGSGLLNIAVLKYRIHKGQRRPSGYRDRITYVWFHFDGSIWMGRNANGNTQVCWVKRTKQKIGDIIALVP